MAREYDPKQGRWLRPDPTGMGAADPSTPQSWNRYAYVSNNPLDAIDATGFYQMPSFASPYGNFWGLNGDCNFVCNDLPLNSFGFRPTVTSLGRGEIESETFYLTGISWYSVQGGHLYASFSGNGTPYWTSPDNRYNYPAYRFNVDEGPISQDANAANNGATISAAPPRPWYKNTSCIMSALGAGALSAVIDGIGVIPEAGGLARRIGHGAGYVGVVADQTGAVSLKHSEHQRAPSTASQGWVIPQQRGWFQLALPLLDLYLVPDKLWPHFRLVGTFLEQQERSRHATNQRHKKRYKGS